MTAADETEYCGFSCEALLRKQKRIVDNILDFNKYNPEFSMVMIGECMRLLYEARNQMVEMKQAEEAITA
jgi:hypothetical protein